MAKTLRAGKARYAALITAEMGKPLAESLAEIDKCAWNCRVVADLAPGWLADREIASDASRSWVSYEPLGVIFAVMPWNFPFWQVLRFACAALSAGNAALLKHSPDVTGCALAIEAPGTSSVRNTPSGKPARLTASSMPSAERGTFEACFNTAVLPAIKAGARKRITCQNGKFQGMIARIGPSGWYVT